MKVRRSSPVFTSLAIAVAALVVTLSVPIPSAEAALITRNLNVTLDASPFSLPFELDLDGKGTGTDFIFTTSFVPGPPASGSAVVTVPLGSISNGVLIDARTGDGFPAASRLGVGALVGTGPGTLFSDLNDQANLFSLIADFDGNVSPVGNFGGEGGFIGLQFDAPGGPLFGFAQVFVNSLGSNDDRFDLTIGLVGFNDVAGEAFAIPSAVVAVVPEPGSLSLLALAGFGLLAATGGRRRVGASLRSTRIQS